MSAIFTDQEIIDIIERGMKIATKEKPPLFDKESAANLYRQVRAKMRSEGTWKQET